MFIEVEVIITHTFFAITFLSFSLSLLFVSQSEVREFNDTKMVCLVFDLNILLCLLMIQTWKWIFPIKKQQFPFWSLNNGQHQRHGRRWRVSTCVRAVIHGTHVEKSLWKRPHFPSLALCLTQKQNKFKDSTKLSMILDIWLFRHFNYEYRFASFALSHLRVTPLALVNQFYLQILDCFHLLFVVVVFDSSIMFHYCIPFDIFLEAFCECVCLCVLLATFIFSRSVCLRN